MRVPAEMESVLRFLADYPYLILFVSVFVAQLAMLLPIVPVLLSAGALAGQGHLHLGGAIAATASAVAAADLMWYELGRWRGGRILTVACRIALEPEACVRRVENLFARHGARLLLGARFVPGLITAALPMAGMFRMYRHRFVLYDGLGALIWCTTYVIAGLLFAEQLAAVGSGARELGEAVFGLAAAVLILYVAWRYLRRRRFLRQLRVARIAPEELYRGLQAGERPMILDLRHPVEFEADPNTIPGALYIPAEELKKRHREIPRKRDVILYCT